MNKEIMNLLTRYVDILPNEYLFTYLDAYPQLIKCVRAPNFNKSEEDNVELLEYLLKHTKSSYLQNWLNFLREPNNEKFKNKVVTQIVNKASQNDNLKPFQKLSDEEQKTLLKLSKQPASYFQDTKDSEGFTVSQAKITPDERYIIEKACLLDPTLLYFFDDAVRDNIKYDIVYKDFKNILLLKKQPEHSLFINEKTPLDLIFSSDPKDVQKLIVFINDKNTPEFVKEFVENLLFISDKKDIYEPAKTVYDLLNSFDVENPTNEQINKINNSLIFDKIFIDPNNTQNHIKSEVFEKYNVIVDDYLKRHNCTFEDIKNFIKNIYTRKNSTKIDNFFTNMNNKVKAYNGDDFIIKNDKKTPQDIQAFGDEKHTHIDLSNKKEPKQFQMSDIDNKYSARNAVYLDNENFFKLSPNMQSDPLVYNAAIQTADFKTVMPLSNTLSRLNIEIPEELKQKIKNIQSTDAKDDKHGDKINQFFKSQIIDPSKK